MKLFIIILLFGFVANASPGVFFSPGNGLFVESTNTVALEINGTGKTSVQFDVAGGPIAWLATVASNDDYAVGSLPGDMVMRTNSKCFDITGDAGASISLKACGSSVVAKYGVTLATAGTQPSCSSANRGQTWLIEGGSGVADILQVCQKDASDNYSWANH